MKKKILFSILTVFALFMFTLNVNAAVTRLSIPNTTKAVAPERIPSTDETLYGTTTEKFDFSKVVFAKDGSGEITGKTDLKKIILGRLKEFDSASGLTLDTTFSSWFTAYCLDNAKKYPDYGLLTSEAYANATDSKVKLEFAMLAAIGNDANIQNAIKAKGLTNKKIYSISLSEDSETYYDLTGTDTAADVVTNIEALNIPVTINLKKISFLLNPVTVEEIVINASDIANHSADGTYYELSFTGKDILLDKYNVTNNSSVTGYDHALWIIEHSYPTLDLQTSITEANGNYEALRKEICELEGKTFDDTALTCNGLTNLDDYVENYVYGTIQYAIWKVTGHTVEGERLGNKINNVTELNKLYTYLINEDRDYDGYSTKTFKNKITVKSPTEKEKLYKETSDAYIYGPYKVNADVLAGDPVTLTITNSDKTGISLVDKNGNKVETLDVTGKTKEFYIECAKKQKISSVTVSIKLTGASVFDPLTNRGRIYYPKYKLEQNVMSGGKIVNKNLETSVELITNPQTGVENVALLLMVTLVAFTLAYLLLSYKQKSVKLD